MKRLLPTLIIFCCITSATSAQADKFRKAKMDSLFDLIEQNDRGMGSISIFQGGEEIYQRAYGYADVAKQIKAGAKTKYRIGSISKTFTAAVIMQLEEEQKLSLNDTINRYFPEIPNADKITIENLLRHSSGLHNFTDDADYATYMETPQTKEQMIRRMISKGVDFEPGQKASYSNTNYVLLTYIAEQKEGKPFDQILQERIFTPCNMMNTYYGINTGKPVAEAFSYHKLSKWEKSTVTNLTIPAGAGAVVTTPHDLNRFYHALFSGRLVSSSGLANMKKSIDGYGIGMFSIPFYDKQAYGHTGGIDDFHSMAAHFESDKLTVSICSNGEVMSMNDILIGALSIYYDMPYELPAFAPSLVLSEREIEQYKGVYSSTSFPLKISITAENKTLIAQATGQSSFPLEAFAPHKFRFEPAMLTIEFIPEESKLILFQSGAMFELTREK